MANLNSIRSVQSITQAGYHRCGPSLYLQVTKGGTKSWLFRYKSPNTFKQREMGLGSITILSLGQARDEAIKCKQILSKGLDPLEERKKERRSQILLQARNITFKNAAEQCISTKAPEWKNKKHAQQWSNTLKT